LEKKFEKWKNNFLDFEIFDEIFAKNFKKKKRCFWCYFEIWRMILAAEKSWKTKIK